VSLQHVQLLHGREELEQSEIGILVAALRLCHATASSYLEQRLPLLAFDHAVVTQDLLTQFAHVKSDEWQRTRYERLFKLGEVFKRCGAIDNSIRSLEECLSLAGQHGSTHTPEALHMCLAEAHLTRHAWEDAAREAETAVSSMLPCLAEAGVGELRRSKMLATLYSMWLWHQACAGSNDVSKCSDIVTQARELCDMSDAKAKRVFAKIHHQFKGLSSSASQRSASRRRSASSGVARIVSSKPPQSTSDSAEKSGVPRSTSSRCPPPAATAEEYPEPEDVHGLTNESQKSCRMQPTQSQKRPQQHNCGKQSERPLEHKVEDGSSRGESRRSAETIRVRRGRQARSTRDGSFARADAKARGAGIAQGAGRGTAVEGRGTQTESPRHVSEASRSASSQGKVTPAPDTAQVTLDLQHLVPAIEGLLSAYKTQHSCVASAERTPACLTARDILASICPEPVAAAQLFCPAETPASPVGRHRSQPATCVPGIKPCCEEDSREGPRCAHRDCTMVVGPAREGCDGAQGSGSPLARDTAPEVEQNTSSQRCEATPAVPGSATEEQAAGCEPRHSSEVTCESQVVGDELVQGESECNTQWQGPECKRDRGSKEEETQSTPVRQKGEWRPTLEVNAEETEPSLEVQEGEAEHTCGSKEGETELAPALQNGVSKPTAVMGEGETHPARGLQAAETESTPELVEGESVLAPAMDEGEYALPPVLDEGEPVRAAALGEGEPSPESEPALRKVESESPCEPGDPEGSAEAKEADGHACPEVHQAVSGIDVARSPSHEPDASDLGSAPQSSNGCVVERGFGQDVVAGRARWKPCPSEGVVPGSSGSKSDGVRVEQNRPSTNRVQKLDSGGPRLQEEGAAAFLRRGVSSPPHPGSGHDAMPQQRGSTGLRPADAPKCDWFSTSEHCSSRHSPTRSSGQRPARFSELRGSPSPPRGSPSPPRCECPRTAAEWLSAGSKQCLVQQRPPCLPLGGAQLGKSSPRRLVVPDGGREQGDCSRKPSPAAGGGGTVEDWLRGSHSVARKDEPVRASCRASRGRPPLAVRPTVPGGQPAGILEGVAEFHASRSTSSPRVVKFPSAEGTPLLDLPQLTPREHGGITRPASPSLLQGALRPSSARRLAVALVVRIEVVLCRCLDQSAMQAESGRAPGTARAELAGHRHAESYVPSPRTSNVRKRAPSPFAQQLRKDCMEARGPSRIFPNHIMYGVFPSKQD